MSAEEILAQVAQEVAQCARCELHRTRKQAVPGEGPADTEIMLIGEGPGFHENEQGRPFVGAAGQFLDELLAQAGLKRSDVWIGNVVKCRPPGNRDPLAEELSACDDYLEQQIKAINPKIIITLGRFSMAKFMPGVKISAQHGKMRKVGNRFVIPMYHPAAALHQPKWRPQILADFSKLPKQLEQAKAALASGVAAKDEPPDEEPTQLSLF